MNDFANEDARPLRVGIAGPVGSGKTALVECLCRELAAALQSGRGDQRHLYQGGCALFAAAQCAARIACRGVETGGCPHAAIRDDVSTNLEAIVELEETLPGTELVLVESGGDNLAASFSPELVDFWIYVIDVSAGDKIPRKGGPGIMRSDLLVINKIDLAPLVGASLEVMERDAKMIRGDRPLVFTNLKDGTGLAQIVAWIEAQMHHAEGLRTRMLDGRLEAAGRVVEHHHH